MNKVKYEAKISSFNELKRSSDFVAIIQSFNPVEIILHKNTMTCEFILSNNQIDRLVLTGKYRWLRTHVTKYLQKIINEILGK